MKPGERKITLSWHARSDGKIAGYLVYRRFGSGNEKLLTSTPFCTQTDRCGGSITFVNNEQPASRVATYRLVTLIVSKPAIESEISVPPVGEGSAKLRVGPGPLAPQDLSATTSAASAELGLPDVIFFALFIAATARFALLRRATWFALVVSIGITSLLAIYWNVFNLNGFPALPGISLAFLLVNADLIWRRLRDRVDIDLASRGRVALLEPI